LNIPYNSKKALSTAEKLMKFITKEARKKSMELAEERGSFPNFEGSIWKKGKGMRNASVSTIAPTGSISIIAGCTSGIEPLFAISFVRNVMMGTRLLEVNKFFGGVARDEGVYSEELMMKIAEKGSIQDMEEIPKNVRRLFVTALDISPEWHVRMQAAFQKHTDNAVSKTVNLKHDATIRDVKKVFLLAHKLGCKGITVYRYGSRKGQVLYIGSGKPEEKYTTAESEFAGGCPVPCIT
jgi:ribonucleoside-diphosphate reductase alpha chain